MIEYKEQYSRDNPSQRYKDLLKQYEQMHSLNEGMFNGRSLVRFAGPIKQIIEKHGCETLLDYGCGKGHPYTDKFRTVPDSGFLDTPIHEFWGIKDITLYDPGEEEHNKLPTGVYDIVVNTDVLEHVPYQDLAWVIKEILNYSTNVVFLNICCLPAMKHFLNGENVHVSLYPVEEWLQFIARISVDYPYLTIYVYADDKNNDKYRLNSYKIIPRPTIIPLKIAPKKDYESELQRWD